MFRLQVIERGDDFGLSGEEGEEDNDFLVLVGGRSERIVVVSILVNLVLEGYGFSELDVVLPRVDSECPGELLLFAVVSHDVYSAFIAVGSVGELLLAALLEFQPLENFVDGVVVQDLAWQVIYLLQEGFIF